MGACSGGGYRSDVGSTLMGWAGGDLGGVGGLGCTRCGGWSLGVLGRGGLRCGVGCECLARV